MHRSAAASDRRTARAVTVERLERRHLLAVVVSTPIDDVVMSIGSAVTPAVVRLSNHFSGGDAGLDYHSSTRFGYVSTSIDAAGNLTLRASNMVPNGFVSAIDQVLVRATSRTNSADFQERAFDVFQRAPVRVGNAISGWSGNSASSGNALSVSPVELASSGSTPRLLAPSAVPRPPAAYDRTFVGDFNGDHADDIAWVDDRGQVWVSPASNETEFRSVARWGTLPAERGPRTVVVGGFNGDGMADIAVMHSLNGTWRVLESTGTNFATPAGFGKWPRMAQWQTIVVGDFDGNGTTDIAGRHYRTGEWLVSRSVGGRVVTTDYGRFSPGFWRSFSVADFNGDGRSDIAAQNQVSGGWEVLAGGGSRFHPAARYGSWSTNVAWKNLTIGDFDADGRADIAAMHPRTGDWIVSRSNGSSFTTGSFGGLGTSSVGRTFVAGDYNFDGKTDIASLDTTTGAWQLLASRGASFAAPATIGSWPVASSWKGIDGLRIGYRVAQSSTGQPSGSLAVGSRPSGGSLYQPSGTSLLIARPDYGPVVNGGGLISNGSTTTVNTGVSTGVTLGRIPVGPGTLVTNGTLLANGGSPVFRLMMLASGEINGPPALT